MVQAKEDQNLSPASCQKRIELTRKENSKYNASQQVGLSGRAHSIRPATSPNLTQNLFDYNLVTGLFSMFEKESICENDSKKCNSFQSCNSNLLSAKPRIKKTPFFSTKKRLKKSYISKNLQSFKAVQKKIKR